MRKFDIQSGLFLLILSVGICVGSLQHEVGTLTAPGSGFFPLVTGLVLGVFSVFILIEARKESKESVKFWSPEGNRKGVYLTVLFILVYALLLERAGFMVTTTLFFFLVSRFVSRHRWSTAVFFGVAASVATYVVFSFLLHAPLPAGMVGSMF